MNNITHYNLNQLVKVEFINPTKTNYKYVPDKKTLFGKVIPAHYYSLFESDATAEDLVKMGYIIKDNQVYRPYKIVLWFSGNYSKVIEHNNEKDALDEHEAILGLCDAEKISLNSFNP